MPHTAEISKAYAISNAKISFVSLVKEAANKRQFLITKAKDGTASFTSGGRIVKADTEHHYVTGIVYEPMVEDTDGNYMTAEEITKAAYWYAKNGDKVDIQHSFKAIDGATVVESWIAKADFEIEGQKISKGTWLMTMEVTDKDVWAAIQKGNITGFSMGGVGEVSEVDVDISGVTKSGKSDAKSLFAKLGEALGLSVVEKGRVADEYKRLSKSQAFWAAFDSLKSALRVDCCSDYYESDETKIREALQEFNDIIVDLLNSSDPITKTLNKGCKKRCEKEEDDELDGKPDCEEQAEPEKDKQPEQEEESCDGDDDKEEEIELTKAEAQEIFEAAITKALSNTHNAAGATEAPIEGNDTTPVEKSSEITAEAVNSMVEAAIAKALKTDDTPVAPETRASMSVEEVQTMIDKAVDKAVAGVMKARKNPSSLNGAGSSAAKEEPHYMHGIL